MKILVTLLLSTVGSVMPLASAQYVHVIDTTQDLHVIVETSGSTSDFNDARFKTNDTRNSPTEIADKKAAAIAYLNNVHENAISRRPKSGETRGAVSSRMSKTGKTSSGPSGEGKAGKSDGPRPDSAVLVEEEGSKSETSGLGKTIKSGKNEVEYKSGKSESGKHSKSGKSGEASEDTATISGTTSKSGKTLFHKSSKKTNKSGKIGSGKSKSGKTLFHKSSKKDGFYSSQQQQQHDDTSDDYDLLPNDSNDSTSPQCKSKKDFNVCVVLGDSRSVCGLGRTAGRNADCQRCNQNSRFCKQDGIDAATCCANFEDMKQFSTGLVLTLEEELPVKKSFSVVQFGYDAVVQSGLSSAVDTLLAIDGIAYTGGGKNQASAIQKCREILSPLFSAYNKRHFLTRNEINRKGIIVLVTDGIPTEPHHDPEGATAAVVELAKEDGIVIVPVLVDSPFDGDAYDFMKSLSSNGEVFDVPNFDSLDDVQQSVVNRVACETDADFHDANTMDDVPGTNSTAPTAEPTTRRGSSSIVPTIDATNTTDDVPDIENAAPTNQPSNRKVLSTAPSNQPSNRKVLSTAPTATPTFGTKSIAPSTNASVFTPVSPIDQSNSPTTSPLTTPPTTQSNTTTPTASPTISPADPTASPSKNPTLEPTCNPFDEFNLCIAVDASGSVCSTSGDRDCFACSPAVMCQDHGINTNTCCNNFATVKEFTSHMVASLGELPVEKSFSVVNFATNAVIESGLSPSSNETIGVLNNMTYLGGATNHADAIYKCQETFADASSSDSDLDNGTTNQRKNLIVLVTDGIPLVPKPDPEGAAELAATLAKDDGVSIIPLFISSTYDEDALDFMGRLSSNGKIFDVTGFDGLDNIRESLVNEVACL